MRLSSLVNVVFPPPRRADDSSDLTRRYRDTDVAEDVFPLNVAE